ncbi:MAG: PAS domain-containing protein [Candidatus Omnitrophica bacterium]|nr:PAS domain-containing protein [Candidatus Omnitrophota bacterium]MDD5661067.1 PAS domain-containing protein [Candidatus Omnitrophota bacterium]
MEIKDCDKESLLKEIARLSRYEQIVENANSIIMIMNMEGIVTFFNKFGQRFFGFYENEIIGKNVIGTIVAQKDNSGRDLVDMIKNIADNPESYSTNENENIRCNGEKVRILWTNKAIISKDGNINEILCIGNKVI